MKCFKEINLFCSVSWPGLHREVRRPGVGSNALVPVRGGQRRSVTERIIAMKCEKLKMWGKKALRQPVFQVRKSQVSFEGENCKLKPPSVPRGSFFFFFFNVSMV